MIGYSFVIPIPPRICLASLATVNAMCTLFLLAIEICAGLAFPILAIEPNLHAKSCALVISVIISANFFCVNWNAPIGLPNCSLCCEYFNATS